MTGKRDHNQCGACHCRLPAGHSGWCDDCRRVSAMIRQSRNDCRSPAPAQVGRPYRVRLLEARAWLELPLFPLTLPQE